MTVRTQLTADTGSASQHAPGGRAEQAVCLAGALLAAAVFPVMGNSLAGDDAATVTRALVDNAGRLQATAMVAVLAAALLFLAAVRLGRAIGGTAGGVALSAGTAVTVLLAAHYSSFAAGAIVGSLMLTNPGPGLAEGTLVAANVVELTRYAAGLALVTAALVARKRLPRAVVAAAGVLAVLTLLPFTSWVAAILVPVWLGVAAATARP